MMPMPVPFDALPPELREQLKAQQEHNSWVEQQFTLTGRELWENMKFFGSVLCVCNPRFREERTGKMDQHGCPIHGNLENYMIDMGKGLGWQGIGRPPQGIVRPQPQPQQSGLPSVDPGSDESRRP